MDGLELFSLSAVNITQKYMLKMRIHGIVNVFSVLNISYFGSL